jgi:hypothetical protein
MSTNRYIDKLKARLANEADRRMQLQALLDDQIARNRTLLAELVELEKDAARWRYTQQNYYFETGPHDTDGDWRGYSVGVLKYVDDPSIIYGHPKGKRQLPLNHCIEGRGDTLQEAIDEALWGTHEEHLA